MANQIWVEFLDTVHVTACLFKSHFKLSFSPLATNIQHWCHIQSNVFYNHWSRAWLACQHCCTSSTHLSLMLFGAVAEFCITMAPPQVHSKKEKKKKLHGKMSCGFDQIVTCRWWCNIASDVTLSYICTLCKTAMIYCLCQDCKW